MRKFAREYKETYPSIARLYESIAGNRRMGSETTVTAYINAIAKFVQYLGFSNPEVALEAMQKGKVNAGEKADSFIDFALKDKVEGGLGLSYATVRSHSFGIKKWLDLSGLDVDWKKIELPSANKIREEDRAPTKEELQKLLNHAGSARDRFVIFGDSSSGLRIGTFLSLKIKDVDLSYPDVARVTVERKRGRKFLNRNRASGRFFMTWLTPEAKTAFKQYLTEREQKGEILTPESPLVTDYNYKGDHISIEAYEKVWARLLKRAGLNQKSNKFHILHIHTLRKYFRSNCIGIDASYREHWMGHKGLYLDMSYFKAEEEKHLAEYRKAVPHLTINAVPTEEKKLRSQMLIDFAKLQGYEPEQLRKLEEVLAKAKDVEEGISEFRKFSDQADTTTQPKKQPKHFIVKGDSELIKNLDSGYSLVKTLDNDRFLMKL